MDQCIVFVCDTNDLCVCFSSSTQFLCCGYTWHPYIAHCVYCNVLAFSQGVLLRLSPQCPSCIPLVIGTYSYGNLILRPFDCKYGRAREGLEFIRVTVDRCTRGSTQPQLFTFHMDPSLASLNNKQYCCCLVKAQPSALGCLLQESDSNYAGYCLPCVYFTWHQQNDPSPRPCPSHTLSEEVVGMRLYIWR